MSCNILFKKENIRNDPVHRLKMHAVQSRWNVVSYTYTRTHTQQRKNMCANIHVALYTENKNVSKF